MAHKQYPKVVMLKKSIVMMASIAVIFIVLLIIHNIFQSSKKPVWVTQITNVQAVATSNDTTWYKNQNIDNRNENASPVSQDQQNKQGRINPEKSTEEIIEKRQEINQNILKAMSAPISSNQLLEQSSNGQNNVGQEIDENKKNAMLDNDYLRSTVENPMSPYELQAGTIIPGKLITGVNSDLPGQLTGQVSSNVYDSISGQYLLVPQGAKLIGAYDSKIAFGQERVLVVWNRIIFPNGQSLNLQGMSGVDMSGYSGFHDEVDNHYRKIFGSVILMSVLSAGAQLSQPQNNNDNWQAPSVGQTMAQGLGTNLLNTGTMMTEKNLNIQPTLEIRPGYEFNITVSKDIVFKRPYAHE